MLHKLVIKISHFFYPPITLFIVIRLLLLIAVPIEGITGYGDLVNYYKVASLGRPFFDNWVEFPPVFPILSMLFYKLSAGSQHAYVYMLVLLFSLAQVCSLSIFIKLAQRIYGTLADRRVWTYMAFLSGLAYGWWYFDVLALWAMLLGVELLLDNRDFRAGVALALGTLTKYFPILALVIAWRSLSIRRAISITLVTLCLTGMVIGGLYILSPAMTMASLRSQYNKGSWETVWALIDNNFITGNFGPETNRFDPQTAGIPTGNPAHVSPWLTLAPFVIFGLWTFLRTRINNPRSAVSLLGVTWAVFLLWSPGWSPQWVLYLIPLILLILDEREGFLMTLTLVLANLLEWPILLSRGLFKGLWITVPVRELLLIFLVYLWYRQLHPALILKPIVDQTD